MNTSKNSSEMKALVDAVDAVTAGSPAPAVAYLAPSQNAALSAAPAAAPANTAHSGPLRKRNHDDSLSAASAMTPDLLPPMMPAASRAKKLRKSASAATSLPPPRQKRLEQNRLAAIESRRRKKVMVEELQRSVAFYTKANASLKKQNEDLEGQIFMARCRVHQMEQAALSQNQNQAAVAVSGSGSTNEASKTDQVAQPKVDDEKKISNDDSKFGNQIQISTDESAKTAPEKNGPNAVIDLAGISYAPVPAPNHQIQPQVQTHAQAQAAADRKQFQQGAAVQGKHKQDYLEELEFTEEQQAHFAATQALYKSMGFPPGAARAAARTLALGSSGGSHGGFGASSSFYSCGWNLPVKKEETQESKVEEVKALHTQMPTFSVPMPMLPPPTLDMTMPVNKAALPDKEVNIAPAPVPTKPSVPVDKKKEEREEEEDSEAATSYIEALNRYAMQQAVAANAAAAAATAAIQAANLQSRLMKNRKNKSTTADNEKRKEEATFKLPISNIPYVSNGMPPLPPQFAVPLHPEKTPSPTSTGSPAAAPAPQGMPAVPANMPFFPYHFNSGPGVHEAFAAGAPSPWGYPMTMGNAHGHEKKE